eukprot:UN02083
MTAGNFFVYANTRWYLEEKMGMKRSSWSSVFISGTWAGGLLSFLSLPTTLIKVQQQMSSSGLGVIQTGTRIIETEGIRGWYRGFLPHFVQAGVGRGFYLCTYEIAKEALGCKENPNSLPRLIIAGGFGGWGGWLFLYPFDVVRNNIFADWKNEAYTGTVDCFKKVY